MSETNFEEMANMSIEELEALELGQGDLAEGQETEMVTQDGDELTGAEEGAEVELETGSVVETEESTVTGASESASGTDKASKEEGDELEGSYVETKDGKGRIPYSVLQETRQKVAELNKRIEELSASNTPYQATLPEDHQDQLAAIEAERDSFKTQFENGDITWEEYHDAMSQYIGKRDALMRSALKAEISTEMTQQQMERAWFNTVDTFVGQAQDGIDYQADEAKRQDLDRFVKMLGQDPSNGDMPAQWFLDTAHAAVLAKHGMRPTSIEQPASTPAQQAKTGVQGKKQTAEPKPSIRTLSDIPGGEIAGASEVEQLGELSGSAITNRFLNNPELIDQHLARLR